MLFLRRQLLQTLSFAFGSSFTLGRKQLGIAAQTALQPKLSPLPAGAAVRDGSAGGTEIEKVTGIGGFFVPSSRSESAGRWYQQHPGDLAHAIELRGFRLAARFRTHRFRSSTGDKRLFHGNRQGLDVELSSPGSRQNGGPATRRWNRGRDGPAVLS
jgi:hypothetical protein